MKYRLVQHQYEDYPPYWSIEKKFKFLFWTYWAMIDIGYIHGSIEEAREKFKFVSGIKQQRIRKVILTSELS